MTVFSSKQGENLTNCTQIGVFSSLTPLDLLPFCCLFQPFKREKLRRRSTSIMPQVNKNSGRCQEGRDGCQPYPTSSLKEASINCHSEHREESLFAFEVNTEMFRFAQHDIFRNYLNGS